MSQDWLLLTATLCAATFVMGVIVGRHTKVEVDLHHEHPLRKKRGLMVSKDPIVLPRRPTFMFMVLTTVVFLLASVGATKAYLKAGEAVDGTSALSACQQRAGEAAEHLWDALDSVIGREASKTRDSLTPKQKEARAEIFFDAVERYRRELRLLNTAREAIDPAAVCRDGIAADPQSP